MKKTDKNHRQQCFFKYMPFETAKIVFKKKTLRWSSKIYSFWNNKKVSNFICFKRLKTVH